MAAFLLAALVGGGGLGVSLQASPAQSPLHDAAIGAGEGVPATDAGVLPDPAPAWQVEVAGRGPAVLPFSLRVGGQTATGLLAVPAGDPTAFVVLAHGWGATAEDHRADLEALAEDGVLAVAMDYRGSRDAFKVAAGVDDTLAATLALQAVHPSVTRTLLYGWSMGGAVALLAAAAAPPGTYDVVVAGAAVTDLAAFWQDIPLARPYLEAEAGGDPSSAPASYHARSPVHHADALAGRVERVWLVHGAADLLVPPTHATRMRDALAEAGQPVALVDAVHNQWGSCVPFVPCVATATAPAGHEAGEFRALRPLVGRLLAAPGGPDDAGLDVRATYDLATGAIGA